MRVSNVAPDALLEILHRALLLEEVVGVGHDLVRELDAALKLGFDGRFPQLPLGARRGGSPLMSRPEAGHGARNDRVVALKY